MTITTSENVPAPAGTSAAEWDTIDGHRFRCIHGQPRGIPGREDVCVAASAVQLADGTIDGGAAVEAPLVFVNVPADGISVADAAALAVALIESVREIDRWRTVDVVRQLKLL